MNLVNNLYQKYNNLKPKHKALADMLGVFLGMSLGALIITFIIANDKGMWLAYALIGYGIFGMIKTLYQFRVEYYEGLERLKK